MSSMVVGMFDDAAQAQRVVRELEQRGVPRSCIDVTTSAGAAPAAQEKGLLARIGEFLTGKDLDNYQAGLRQGRTVVSVETEDALAQETETLMQSSGAVNVNRRSTAWQASGGAARAAAVQQEVRVPVVEEALKVGKREVEGGGVRVETHVVEQPVEEQVSLRQERVTIERHPVDRPVTDADVQAFQDRTIEVTERSEEAVIAKEARVVEEVVVGKTVEQQTQTVRETLRRTDVQIVEIPTETRVTDMEQYTVDFQSHFDTQYADSGYSYDQFAPAYRYGRELAGHSQFRDQPWPEVEQHARTTWEQHNPGTWDQFGGAVRYGWDRR